jgi:hypothetical protein
MLVQLLTAPGMRLLQPPAAMVLLVVAPALQADMPDDAQGRSRCHVFIIICCHALVWPAEVGSSYCAASRAGLHACLE